MHCIKLTKSELIKRFLYLKFEGVCKVGTSGNIDADYIIKTSIDKLNELEDIQALIFDFTDLDYKFGNRFLKLFDSNIYRNNTKTPISIISNSDSLANWKQLFEYGNLKFDFYGNTESIFQDNIKSAIKSINKRFNNKTKASR